VFTRKSFVFTQAKFFNNFLEEEVRNMHFMINYMGMSINYVTLHGGGGHLFVTKPFENLAIFRVLRYKGTTTGGLKIALRNL
jgi:hypothetical protein